MWIIEILKAIFLGIVEGITEWLPISSTGHMILIDEFLKLKVTDEFKEMFLVVIQLGAILSVVFLYWNKIFPFKYDHGIKVKRNTMILWFKIIVSCIVTGVIGLPLNDFCDEHFYNYQTVAIMLIIFGILFIIVENRHKNHSYPVDSLSKISYKSAFLIGVFQLIAALLPGTSRSGATIVGALMLGISRPVATEYTFFLGIPVMFGASIYKLIKFGFHFTGYELTLLIVGMLVAFFVSIFAIKFLMNYIKKHNFKVFGWYRIILGVAVLAYFGISSLIN